MANFEYLKPGDEITRLLGGSVRMPMIVREVSGDLVICDVIHNGKIFYGGWAFDRNSGVEEDASLQWGIKYGKTGSVLIKD